MRAYQPHAVSIKGQPFFGIGIFFRQLARASHVLRIVPVDLRYGAKGIFQSIQT